MAGEREFLRLQKKHAVMAVLILQTILTDVSMQPLFTLIQTIGEP